jgi:predicted nucleotidyltransferase
MGTVRRELKGLTACGVSIETRDGNRTSYEANPKCPIYSEIAGMVRKTSGLVDVLQGALAGFTGRICAAFVYGSYARGNSEPGSDVDLMVIGETGFGKVVSPLGGVQELTDREINPTVYSPNEFRSKALGGHYFIKAVLADEKPFIVGDADELGELAV